MMEHNSGVNMEKKHRDNDLPAIISSTGTQWWFQYGKKHRDNDLPAIIRTDGKQAWYKNGIKMV